MNEPVNKAFEARIFAMLEQQNMELRTLNVQMIGLMAAVAMIGLGLYAIGKGVQQ